MPIPHDFTEARLKVERAERHIREVEHVWAGYLETDFCTLGVHRNAEGRDDALFIQVTQSIPPALSLAIGDAVHNLRSALDYATSSLFPGNKSMSFPVHEERHTLVAAFATNPATSKKGSHAAIQKISPDLVAFIVNTIKPYRAGNLHLWATANLDNADKHRLLTPIVSVSSIKGVTVRGPMHLDDCTISTVREYFSPFPAPSGGWERPIEIKSQGQPTAHIRFGKGNAFENDPVIPTLVQFRDAVAETLTSLSEFLRTTS